VMMTGQIFKVGGNYVKICEEVHMMDLLFHGDFFENFEDLGEKFFLVKNICKSEYW
jgi:hypothetical protein